ncbi:hypothetical protein HDE_13758 [Halotydeus destructor]|nr:hypothetical protein HDE_13758 [Halotydeus destructor]
MACNCFSCEISIDYSGCALMSICIAIVLIALVNLAGDSMITFLQHTKKKECRKQEAWTQANLPVMAEPSITKSSNCHKQRQQSSQKNESQTSRLQSSRIPYMRYKPKEKLKSVREELDEVEMYS